MAGEDRRAYLYKFIKAEYKLKEQGHIVINPAVLPEGLSATSYMPICLAMLQQADAICMIGDDWQTSAGAQTELQFAKYQQKKIIYLSALDLQI